MDGMVSVIMYLDDPVIRAEKYLGNEEGGEDYMSVLKAGASQVEITPKNSQFLFGYPHVERYSTGVHDPLLSSVLYLSDGVTEVLFSANDIIFIPKDLAGRARRRIEEATGIPAANIMITATHTHSGPITLDYLSNEADPVVPKTDPEYVRFMEDQIVDAAVKAFENAQPAEAGLALADATGIGTNRRDPAGPCDMDVPVLWVRSTEDGSNIALMLVCCMHPTVLHEDTTLITGDFPGLARRYLQETVVGGECPVLHHTGPQGNQSPRHVTKENTFEEAVRLGKILGHAAEKAMDGIVFGSNPVLGASQEFIELIPKGFPPVEEAQAMLQQAVDRLEHLRTSAAPATEVRTAECDWFGAEETLTLAKASADGRMDAVRKTVMPAEIQVITIGPWRFIGWPGEMFVEFDLMVKAKAKNAFVIAMANGELQGYVVTPEAAAEGGYEASNGLFVPESGALLVEKTLEMLG